jgi:6,7-dimethyl-8-ribityllumazine synthase
MSGDGAPVIRIEGASNIRVAIVASRWHEKLMDALVDGAQRGTRDAGVSAEPMVLRVAGAFELPVAASRLAKSGRFDAIVCLGLIVRGMTPHFDYVCHGVTAGIMQASVDTGIPIGFGVLTCDTDRQAFKRSGLPGSNEDKGHEAATAAIAAAVVLRDALS